MAGPFVRGACDSNGEITGALGDTNQNQVRTTCGNRVAALCVNAWGLPRSPEQV